MGQEEAEMSETPTREDRLQWCKDRAVKYLPASPADAMTSFMSDAQQTGVIDWDRPAMLMLSQLGMMHAISGDANEMRRWIEGFN